MLNQIKYWCERNLKSNTWLWNFLYLSYQKMSAAKIEIARLKGSWGVLPDFVIIGTQKGGTSSLYYYLSQHPDIHQACVKGTYFFDWNYQKGISWYRSNFPFKVTRRFYKKILGKKFLTGEASANYIFRPHAPERLQKCAPKAKIIVLLRNPVSRAYSAYNMFVKKGQEKSSFEEALEQERKMPSPEIEKMLKDENNSSHPYLARGIYVDQLKAWRKYFPAEQMLILKSEDLFAHPKETLNRVFFFLGLPDHKLKHYPKTNTNKYEQMDPTTKKKLISYYRPHNKRLSEFLKEDFSWGY